MLRCEHSYVLERYFRVNLTSDDSQFTMHIKPDTIYTSQQYDWLMDFAEYTRTLRI